MVQCRHTLSRSASSILAGWTGRALAFYALAATQFGTLKYVTHFENRLPGARLSTTGVAFFMLLGYVST